MEHITFSCSCGKQLRADASFVGKRLRCPQCQNIVVAPETEIEAPPLAEPWDFQETPNKPTPKANPVAEATRTSSGAIVFAILACVPFLTLSGVVAMNMGDWGNFDWGPSWSWASWILSHHFWRIIFLLGPLVCGVGIVFTVFWGHRQKRKGIKLRAAGVMLLFVGLAAVYAFAPGWYQPTRGPWVLLNRTFTSNNQLEYFRVVAFEPIFRLSPLIFLSLGTALSFVALCFPRKSMSQTFVWDQLPNESTSGSHTGIEVSASYWFLTPFMYFSRPVFVINGKECKRAWRGRYFFDLKPGRYTLEVFRRFLFVRCTGHNEIEIRVCEGEIVQVNYSVVGIFSRGSFRRKRVDEFSPLSNGGLWGRATLNGLGAALVLFVLVMGYGLITTQSRDRAMAHAAAPVAGVFLILWLLFAVAAIPLDYIRLKFSQSDRSWRPGPASSSEGSQSLSVLSNFVLCIVLIVGVLIGPVLVTQQWQRTGSENSDRAEAPRVSSAGQSRGSSSKGSTSSTGSGSPHPVQPNPLINTIPTKQSKTATKTNEADAPAVLIGAFENIVTGRVGGGGLPRTFTVRTPKDHKIFVIRVHPKNVSGLIIENEKELKAYQRNGGLLASLNGQLGYRQGETCVLAHDGQFQVEDNKGVKHPCLLVLHKDALSNRVSGNIGGRQLFGATAAGKNAMEPFRVFAIMPVPRHPESLIGLPGIGSFRFRE